MGSIYFTGREGLDGEGTGTASIVDDDGRWEEGAGGGRKGKEEGGRPHGVANCRWVHE